MLSNATSTRPSPLAIAVLVGCMLIALLAGATLAQAGKRGVKDDRKETKALKKNGRVDIVRAGAGSAGKSVVHRVTMRKRVKPGRGRERPGILINTRGGRSTDPEYLVFASRIYEIKKRKDKLKEIGRAKLRAKGRTWTYRFESKQIPGLKRYGWAAITEKGKARDIAPARRYAKNRA